MANYSQSEKLVRNTHTHDFQLTVLKRKLWEIFERGGSCFVWEEIARRGVNIALLFVSWPQPARRSYLAIMPYPTRPLWWRQKQSAAAPKVSTHRRDRATNLIRREGKLAALPQSTSWHDENLWLLQSDWRPSCVCLKSCSKKKTCSALRVITQLHSKRSKLERGRTKVAGRQVKSK